MEPLAKRVGWALLAAACLAVGLVCMLDTFSKNGPTLLESKAHDSQSLISRRKRNAELVRPATFHEDKRTRFSQVARHRRFASADVEEQRLPQAIIIGVKKAGTRALFEYLKLNPQIKGPGPEVHFFDRHFSRGTEWYRKQMPHTKSGEWTVEKTPSYFITRDAPQRVLQLNPDTKLILVVRDPVTRALSDYAQATSKRPDMLSFEQLAFRHSDGDQDDDLVVNPRWGGVRLGLYARFLRRWLQYFPKDNILVVSGEQLIENPAEEANLVEDFLGVPRRIKPEHFQYNVTKGFPCLQKTPSSSPKCLGKTKGRPHPDVAPALLERLRDFFRPHNQEFYHLAGRNFHW